MVTKTSRFEASDEQGLSEAAWQTGKPNKKGIGGTANGNNNATVTGLGSASHQWDGVDSEVNFTIGAAGGQSNLRHNKM